MAQFECVNCHSAVVAPDAAVQWTCSNCNTRQTVRTSTEPATIKPPAPPDFHGAWLLGGCLIVGGILLCIVALAAAGSASLFFFGLITGLSAAGIGVAIQLLRTIAMDTWHMRHHMPK